MARYASGKRSLAICDRCGISCKYVDLKREWTNQLVCKSCYDKKHPQLNPPKIQADAEALRHARPDRVEPFVISVGDILPTPPFDSAPLNVVATAGRATVLIS